jgi:hypothetical protein
MELAIALDLAGLWMSRPDHMKLPEVHNEVASRLAMGYAGAPTKAVLSTRARYVHLAEAKPHGHANHRGIGHRDWRVSPGEARLHGSRTCQKPSAGFRGNLRGVPRYNIRQAASRWQPWEGPVNTASSQHVEAVVTRYEVTLHAVEGASETADASPVLVKRAGANKGQLAHVDELRID